jgi:flavin reductase (DIM6/NTAB) family NADH-FMN oxidoreductase RutF
MPKTRLPPNEALYPAPVVLVSCAHRNKANIIAIAWCGVVCSEPPLLSISVRPSRHSYSIIKEAHDFVVNIPDEPLLEKCDFCGITSGKTTDKFGACGFTKSPAYEVSSPLIEECPVNIECRLVKTVELGTHEMFIGQVVAVHADDDILDARGNIDYKKAAPIVYNRGEYWGLGKRLGTHGFSSRK